MTRHHLRDLFVGLAVLLASSASVAAPDIDVHEHPTLRGGKAGLAPHDIKGTAIYAFASDRDVGVDIEATSRDVEIDGVARTVFSPPECAALAAMASDARRAAFFRIWTRKEAYVKFLGDGLGYPTRSFSVSDHADDDALVGDEKDAGAPRRCRVIALPAPPGFAAALAATGRDWSVVEVDAAP